MEEKVAEMEIPQEFPPWMVQHRFLVSLDAIHNFWLFMSMFIVGTVVKRIKLYNELIANAI